MRAKQEIERLQQKIASGDLDPDEPLFVLRAQDAYASAAVRFWATIVEARALEIQDAQQHQQVKAKIDEARNWAAVMEDWPYRKVPGTSRERESQ